MSVHLHVGEEHDRLEVELAPSFRGPRLPQQDVQHGLIRGHPNFHPGFLGVLSCIAQPQQFFHADVSRGPLLGGELPQPYFFSRVDDACHPQTEEIAIERQGPICPSRVRVTPTHGPWTSVVVEGNLLCTPMNRHDWKWVLWCNLPSSWFEDCIHACIEDLISIKLCTSNGSHGHHGPNLVDIEGSPCQEWVHLEHNQARKVAPKYWCLEDIVHNEQDQRKL
mmetsp:Transcript_23284/g.53632  ORF Transcript_23284/g.53632 Transcript_23284/m.53632 type:complete len:222 (+) Transcript_23284:390-1055(+)